MQKTCLLWELQVLAFYRGPFQGQAECEWNGNDLWQQNLTKYTVSEQPRKSYKIQEETTSKKFTSDYPKHNISSPITLTIQ